MNKALVAPEQEQPELAAQMLTEVVTQAYRATIAGSNNLLYSGDRVSGVEDQTWFTDSPLPLEWVPAS
ncbi:MAG: hypothetical protein M3306_08950 [Actinomycetota bacterium]|nr:hypothetical protein [Actinomycetota bacterium]